MQVLLLAGARSEGVSSAERLQHVPSLPVANVPLIIHTISMLRDAGLTDFTVNVFYAASQTVRILRRLTTSDLRIRFIFERRHTGSGHVLRQFRGTLGEPFLVTPTDIFLARLDADGLLEAHRASGAAATLVATRHAVAGGGYGQVDVDDQGRLTGVSSPTSSDSQSLTSTGIYIFDPAVVERVPADRQYEIGRDLLPALLTQEHTIRVVETDAQYQRINSIRQYWELNTQLACGWIKRSYPLLDQHGHGETPRVHPTASLHGPVLLGAGSEIQPDVVIRGPAVIGDNVIVGRGTRLEEVVVLPNTEIGFATEFRRCVLFDNQSAGVDGQLPVSVGDPAVLAPKIRSSILEWLESGFHRAVALCLLVVLLPLVLMVAFAIRLQSRGPIFYTQLRVGRRRFHRGGGFYPGHVFEFIKFRTMHVGADKALDGLVQDNEYHNATFVKLKRDPRVTSVGRVLRLLSIDELPQLINVVKGDMRLVGNRPLPLYEAIQLNEPWQQIRFTAPAGITGLWQVSGRSNLSLEERIILDNYYAVSRSFLGDLGILLLTIPAVLRRSEAA